MTLEEELAKELRGTCGSSQARICRYLFSSNARRA
jgi:hypothetical protein